MKAAGIIWASCISLMLAGTSAAARQFPGQAAQAAQEEAQLHYRTALVALKNNDLVVAAREFREAASRAPNNPLIWYNLGVVEGRQKSPQLALDYLKKAIGLGLPPKEKQEADDLVPTLMYQLQKIAREDDDARQRLVNYASELESTISNSSNFKVERVDTDSITIVQKEYVHTKRDPDRLVNVTYRISFYEVVPTSLRCNIFCSVTLNCANPGCMQRDTNDVSFLILEGFELKRDSVRISWNDEYSRAARRAAIALNALIESHK